MMADYCLTIRFVGLTSSLFGSLTVVPEGFNPIMD